MRLESARCRSGGERKSSSRFTLTFASDAARDGYLVHPDHLAFVKFAGPLLEKSLVVDYWAQG